MQTQSLSQAMRLNFLDHAPAWYKTTIIMFLILNPILLNTVGPFVTGWAFIAEFIFVLAMALKCYPLPVGGLLAIEALILGMTSPKSVYTETLGNFQVILLLIFMVAGIHFMKDFLRFIFTGLLVRVKSKMMLSFMFCSAGAFLSAFLDALTVTAVIIAVAQGFYEVYHRHASQRGQEEAHDHTDDNHVKEEHRKDLDQFRGFLRNLMMHGAVGTALGGVTTLVGEPQNLLIGEKMGWNFGDFFLHSSPVTMPVLAVGLLTCLLVEITKTFGYGFKLPETVRLVLASSAQEDARIRTTQDKLKLVIQGIMGVYIIVALAFHIAEVGLIGLSVIVVLTAMNGVTDEHKIGHAFLEALPFTSLLVVFFAIVALIHDQHLFAPVVEWTLTFEGKKQLLAFYGASGALSAISDNVFVATVYITEALKAFAEGRITREQLELVAVAINTGTNIPSVATPNGQAAFLFLLTSGVAPLIRLSYMRMVVLALPYTIVMTTMGALSVYHIL